MNRKVVDILFLCISIGLCFNNIPFFLRYGTIISHPIGGYIIFYPILAGIIYTCYYQYKYKNIFKYFNIFKKFSFTYICILTISLCLGFYNYPYFDLVFTGPNNQIEKIPKLMEAFSLLGIELKYELMFKLWLFIRLFKNIILETVYCFGCSYMIFCWYFNDYRKGITIFCKGILIGVVLFISYGIIDVFYLAGNDSAKEILMILNPYIHTISSNNGWWPPLLWKNQLRSLFSEPSNIGNYIAVVIPVVWFYYYKFRYKLALIANFCIIFMICLSHARTAYAMCIGICLLMLLFILYLKRWDFFEIIYYFTFMWMCVSWFFNSVYWLRA